MIRDENIKRMLYFVGRKLGVQLSLSRIKNKLSIRFIYGDGFYCYSSFYGHFKRLVMQRVAYELNPIIRLDFKGKPTELASVRERKKRIEEKIQRDLEECADDIC